MYGVSPPVTGIFNQSGGTLNADTINLNPGGIFNQTGGTLTCTTFNHQGGTVAADSNLENRGEYNYYSGYFTGRLLNYGAGSIIFHSDSFTAGNGMAHHSSPLEIYPGYRVQPHLKRPGLEVDQGAEFKQNGGSLTTTETIIGNTGIGTFTQTGGTHTVNNPSTLILGKATGSTGTYNLQLNGVLKTNNTIVGNFGTGTFNQTGGTHTVTNDLSLGNASSSIGTYNLSGGTLSTSSTTIGKAGGGIFNQSGKSTHKVSGTLTLGSNPNSSGSYILDDGTLSPPPPRR